MQLNSSIPLPLQAWLMHDDYDYVQDDNYISATSLLQPTRSIILAGRVNQEEVEPDMDSLVSPRIGTAIHESIEKVWSVPAFRKDAIMKLGYPEKIVDSMDVHVEERAKKQLDSYMIGGKYDLVINGNLFDFKTTSVYTWINGDREKDYQLQGSIYRWLNPELITSDCITICFIFTGWSQKDAAFKDNYPPHRLMQKDIPLLSLVQTERWIRSKLNEIEKNRNLNQDEMIQCSDEELWRTQPVFKYYASGDTTKRATKNFNTAQEAAAYKSNNKNKGVIVMVPGEPKRCNYCAAASICEQRKAMIGVKEE